MAYEKQTDIPCADGETVVKLLDIGELVAVQCPASRDDSTNMNLFAPSARWIDTTGATKTDPSGRKVSTVRTVSIAPGEVARLTPTVIVRECVCLVLGEPLTPDPDFPDLNLLKWGPDTVAQMSIRNAIAAASIAAPAAADVL
ncbi:hypothetical protein [Dyella amyloliquefaciens]|uniref:hypothetical protein n=1 Tax=Dyella amyloliquefaciens TaxID=1770545 RepID=UPI00102EB908|nr:hypothetical protein [Dyella amyloliquefaciens]